MWLRVIDEETMGVKDVYVYPHIPTNTHEED